MSKHGNRIRQEDNSYQAKNLDSYDQHANDFKRQYRWTKEGCKQKGRNTAKGPIEMKGKTKTHCKNK